MAKDNAQIGKSRRTGPDNRVYRTQAVESLVLIMSGRDEFKLICFSKFA